MLWLGGFLSLELTTSTPDALCPPLEEARAAVKARVGEVRGDYHAEFGLIRADEGAQTLEIRLREGPREVLRRELAIDSAGCVDSAQALALVLERYFDAIERVPPAPPGLEVDHRASTLEPTPIPSRARSAQPSRPFDSLFQAGFLYDRELGLGALAGLSWYPAALRLSSNVGWGAALHLAPFFTRRQVRIRERSISAFSLQSALYVPLSFTRSPFRASLGPWAQLRLQRADAPALEHARPAYRVLPGLGAALQLEVYLSERWQLMAGMAGGGQLRGAASTFVLKRDSERIAVLVPELWFAQALVALEVKL